MKSGLIVSGFVGLIVNIFAIAGIFKLGFWLLPDEKPFAYFYYFEYVGFLIAAIGVLLAIRGAFRLMFFGVRAFWID